MIRKKTNKKEKERLGSLRVLCRACLFIYFCSGLCAHYTRWMVSLALFLSYTQTGRFQAAAGKEKKDEYKDEERKIQKEEYGRNCRQSLSSSSSTYSNVGVLHKTEKQ